MRTKLQGDNYHSKADYYDFRMNDSFFFAPCWKCKFKPLQFDQKTCPKCKCDLHTFRFIWGSSRSPKLSHTLDLARKAKGGSYALTEDGRHSFTFNALAEDLDVEKVDELREIICRWSGTEALHGSKSCAPALHSVWRTVFTDSYRRSFHPDLGENVFTCVRPLSDEYLTK